MQGCRSLGPGESYLQVDYQVSCEGDGYTAWMVFGFVGVCAVPLGIPMLTMLVLVKNSQSIREGSEAYHRYEFLVADYKPDFFFVRFTQ